MTAPMGYAVSLTEAAEADLADLSDYIATHDAPAKADYVLGCIEAALLSLEAFPERGAYVKELLALGIRDYRETYFKPYRIIYRVVGLSVAVHLVVDGRRDLRSVLARRLLQA
jgi:toxin ParE1/3/4